MDTHNHSDIDMHRSEMFYPYTMEALCHGTTPTPILSQSFIAFSLNHGSLSFIGVLHLRYRHITLYLAQGDAALCNVLLKSCLQ